MMNTKYKLHLTNYNISLLVVGCCFGVPLRKLQLMKKTLLRKISSHLRPTSWLTNRDYHSNYRSKFLDVCFFVVLGPSALQVGETMVTWSYMIHLITFVECKVLLLKLKSIQIEQTESLVAEHSSKQGPGHSPKCGRTSYVICVGLCSHYNHHSLGKPWGNRWTRTRASPCWPVCLGCNCYPPAPTCSMSIAFAVAIHLLDLLLNGVDIVDWQFPGHSVSILYIFLQRYNPRRTSGAVGIHTSISHLFQKLWNKKTTHASKLGHEQREKKNAPWTGHTSSSSAAWPCSSSTGFVASVIR